MINSYLYQKGKPFQSQISRPEMFAALGQKESILWVDLVAPTEFEEDTLVEIFNFHPLAVEDCITDKSSPKADDYEEYQFIVAHAIYLNEKDELATIELDIFLSRNYLVTFHKKEVPGVQQVRDLVMKKPDAYLGRGTDLLFHAIFDHLVDNYMPVIDRYDRKIDQLEEHIFENPPQDYLATLVKVKHDIFNLRRLVAAQRDNLHYLIRTPNPFIRQKYTIYFRDVYDHLNRIYGMAESFHENLASILQAYFSYSSNKLNDVMRRMTVLATLTMPMVIIASIYGMNFKFMPELEWQYGYFFSLGLMALVAVVMVIWMKHKKWF